MKKILSLLLVFILCLTCLCACSDKGHKTTYEPTGEYIGGTVTVLGKDGETILSEEVSVGQFVATNAAIKACEFAEVEYEIQAGEFSSINGIDADDTNGWYFIIDGLQSANGNLPIEDGFEVTVLYAEREINE